MKAVLFSVVLMFSSGVVTWSQTTKSDLERLYGPSTGNVFSAGPGISVTAYYGSAGRVCGLIVAGAKSEHDVMQVFDAVAPSKSRGAKKIDMEECAGGCQHVLEYEKASLYSGVFDGYQTSTPSAIVTLKQPTCERVVEAVRKTALNLSFIGR